MPVAFLSHSSKDKGLVGPVAASLKAANVIYDELTFEQGNRSINEIEKGIARSDLFVLFLSKSSIDSDWVNHELRLAERGLINRNTRIFLVFILDDTPRSALPSWLSDYVFRRIKSPVTIANVIRSKLIELDVDQVREDSFFVGRETELEGLKKALSRPSTESPLIIELSGWDGIGRKTLAQKALSETFPWLGRSHLEITLEGDEGEAGFYRRLLDAEGRLTGQEFLSEMERFINSGDDEKTTKICDILKGVISDRQITFLKGHSSLLQDTGDFQPWLQRVFKNLPDKNFPYMVVMTRRAVPFRKRKQYSRILFQNVRSLSMDHSRDLLSQWLKRYNIDFDTRFLNEVTPYVNGHPKNVQIAAEFVRACPPSGREPIRRDNGLDVLTRGKRGNMRCASSSG